VRLQLNDWPPFLSHAIAFGIGASALAMTVESDVEPLRIARGYVLMNRLDIGPLQPTISHSTLAERESLTVVRKNGQAGHCKLATVEALTFRTGKGAASVFRLDDARHIIAANATVLDESAANETSLNNCSSQSQVIYDR